MITLRCEITKYGVNHIKILDYPDNQIAESDKCLFIFD